MVIYIVVTWLLHVLLCCISCRKCKGLLRPHVVWFGEGLDPAVLEEVDKVLKQCDLCLLVSE